MLSFTRKQTFALYYFTVMDLGKMKAYTVVSGHGRRRWGVF